MVKGGAESNRRGMSDQIKNERNTNAEERKIVLTLAVVSLFSGPNGKGQDSWCRKRKKKERLQQKFGRTRHVCVPEKRKTNLCVLYSGVNKCELLFVSVCPTYPPPSLRNRNPEQQNVQLQHVTQALQQQQQRFILSEGEPRGVALLDMDTVARERHLAPSLRFKKLNRKLRHPPTTFTSTDPHIGINRKQEVLVFSNRVFVAVCVLLLCFGVTRYLTCPQEETRAFLFLV